MTVFAEAVNGAVELVKARITFVRKTPIKSREQTHIMLEKLIGHCRQRAHEDAPVYFQKSEYEERIAKVNAYMRNENLDALVATSPANINYLTGYDANSEYVFQCVLVSEGREPIWIGRQMDARSARGTTWLADENIRSYTDDLLDIVGAHPVDFFVDVLRELRLEDKRIGIEMDGNHLSPLACEKLKTGLRAASFKDASLLVNRIRAIKSAREIEYIRQAAKLTQSGMKRGIEVVREGVKECEVGIAVYDGLTRDACDPPPGAGTWSITSGRRTAMTHLGFTDKRIERGDVVTFEISGSMHRYACPMVWSVAVGEHSEIIDKAIDTICSGLDMMINTIKPGISCEQIARVYRNVVKDHGFSQRLDGRRCGYTFGIAFDLGGEWGEKVASFKEGDRTVLKPNMTFHVVPALPLDGFAVICSDSMRVTEDGCEAFHREFQRKVLANYS